MLSFSINVRKHVEKLNFLIQIFGNNIENEALKLRGITSNFPRVPNKLVLVLNWELHLGLSDSTDSSFNYTEIRCSSTSVIVNRHFGAGGWGRREGGSKLIRISYIEHVTEKLEDVKRATIYFPSLLYSG